MSLIFLCCFHILITSSTNLLCNEKEWTSVIGSWEFTNTCEIQNTDSQHTSMTWIGENDPTTIQWSDYTVEATMIPKSSGGNTGVAFHVQNTSPVNNGGTYYAISFNLGRPACSFAKWYQNTYTEIAEMAMSEQVLPDIEYNVKVINNGNSFSFYIDGTLLGTYADPHDPPLLSGTVGLRNYYCPTAWSSLRVILPDGEEYTGNAGKNNVGGWIFIGCVLGLLFLYCMIGCLINCMKYKKYCNAKNMPNYGFWVSLPKLFIAGCMVTYTCIKVKCCVKGAPEDDNEYSKPINMED